MRIVEKPFSIVALAPFIPTDAKAVTALKEVTDIDQALAALAPSIYLPLPQHLSPEGGIELVFRSMNDFTPDRIIARTPWLKKVADMPRRAQAVATSPPDDDPLASLLDMVATPDAATPEEVEGESNTEVDAIVSGVVKRVLNAPGFQELESAWRGLALLCKCPLKDIATVSILPVTNDDPAETLEGLTAILGDNPPDLLLLDIPFDATPLGMKLLEAASGLAERIVTPIACCCGHRFFQIDSWDSLDSLPYLPNHLDGFSFARWKTLKAASSAFWTLACCNGIILRPPFSGSFKDQSPPVASPVWGLAALMLESMSETGNPARAAAKRLSFEQRDEPTETVFSEERTQQLLECGLLPLLKAGRARVGIPPLKTLDGSPIAVTMAVSRVIHILLALREDSGPSDEGQSLADELQLAFEKHLASCCRRDVAAVTVDYSKTVSGGKLQLAVSVALSASDSSQRIEFTFDW